MANDVVVYYGEFKTISAEISNYITFLIEKLKKYKSNLHDIQMIGIQDELIRGKIGNITLLIDNYIAELETILQKSLIHIKAGNSAVKTKNEFNCSNFVTNTFLEIQSTVQSLI